MPQVQQMSQVDRNMLFMSRSHEQPAAAFAQNGTQYVPGQALNYDAPVLSGAYLSRITLSVSLNVNVTHGTGTATLNAGGIYNVLAGGIQVKFGETQITIHPYFEKVFNQMRGFNRPGPTTVYGNQNTDVQSLVYSAPALSEGANTWKFDIDIPLNSVHPETVNGLLPLGQTGTKVQIQAIPASSFTGNDPLSNVVALTGNAAVSVTGTVNVTCWVRDFHSFSMLSAVGPDLTGLPTVQIIKPQEINPLTAGTTNFRTITNPYPLVSAVSVVIDGQSSATFCAASNINTLELDQAENTNSAFFRYNDTAGGMARFYQQLRRIYGQDFEDGVLPWFDAPAHNSVNSSNLSGVNYLDLTGNGYPAARLGVGVNSVATGNGITPRVVTYARILNNQGITLA